MGKAEWGDEVAYHDGGLAGGGGGDAVEVELPKEVVRRGPGSGVGGVQGWGRGTPSSGGKSRYPSTIHP